MGKKLDALLNTHLHSEVDSTINARRMNNKAHNKSPFGEPEPSTRTEIK